MAQNRAGIQIVTALWEGAESPREIVHSDPVLA